MAEPQHVVVQHKGCLGCGSGCAPVLGVLLLAGLAINYWYVAAPLALLAAGGYYWAWRTGRLPEQAAPASQVAAVAALEDPAAPTKTCPDCAETVLAAARRCRYCGYTFNG